MLVRTIKNWELPESAVTPERDYILRPRRDFLKTLGLGLAGAVLAPRGLLGALAGFPPRVNPVYRDPALTPTAYEFIAGYNNFYEFGTDKSDPKAHANTGWKTEPWTIEIAGLTRNPVKIDVDDLIGKMGGIEQRVYRHRCVEAWAMVVPWDGFPLARLVAFADPKPGAKFVKFTTVKDAKNLPGQRTTALIWPYVEGLRLDEANHELTFIATGVYGRPILNQNGAPLRLVVPWKYGFKGGKSLVKIEFVAREPRNTWNIMAPAEYGFYANVNPKVDHPRWSQASEHLIGRGGLGSRQKTLPFNGYESQVAALYQGMNLKKYY